MKNKLLYNLLPTSAALLLSSGLITLACSGNAQISAFFRNIALGISRWWGLLWSLSPLPAPELIYIAVPILGAWLIYLALWRKKPKALWIFSTPFILFFMFIALFGVHYTAPPLSQSIGIKVEKYSPSDLADTLQRIIQEMNNYAPQLERDGNNVLLFPSFDQTAQQVLQGYSAISEKYPVFSPILTAPRPKAPLFSSKIMSYLGIAGYYFPFTATPMVSTDSTATQLAYNTAHEWAHAGGIGPEDECNFAAFLACSATGDPLLQYSAVFNGYIYVGNALFATNPDLASSIMQQLNPLCREDIRTLNRHLEQYETPVQQVGTAINDAYIKSTGQPDGVKSYGKMVDLLISYYKEN